MTQICVHKLTSIGSDNGLSPGRRQAIIWTVILLNGSYVSNFCETWIEIHTFSLEKMHVKMSGKWRPLCFGFNVLISLNSKKSLNVLLDTVSAPRNYHLLELYSKYVIMHEFMMSWVSWVSVFQPPPTKHYYICHSGACATLLGLCRVISLFTHRITWLQL